MRQQCKGSLTIFAALTIMLVAQLIFVLLEGARYCEAGKIAVIRGRELTESIMAQYCKPLWDEYHLLALDGQNSGEYLECTSSGLGKNLLNSELTNISMEGYVLLGDQAGAVYTAAVSKYMKENLIYEEAQLIYSYYMSLKDIRNYDTANALSQQQGEKASMKNDLEDVQEIKAGGLLELVLGDDASVSSCKIQNDRPSRRAIQTGTDCAFVNNEWLERVMLCQYFSSYMSSYSNIKENHHMKYELEYILGGKDNDRDNLEAVAYQLLAFREAANMLYLATDSVKDKEALAVATAIAGASVNPLVIEAVKLEIIAAWAYCESILDLRTLFHGERISLMKSNATWTSGLTGMKEILVSEAKAKPVKDGLGYREYTSVLLMFAGDGTKAYRAMDVQEATLRDMMGYENIRMDWMMESIRLNISYKYQPIFGSMVNLIKGPNVDLSKIVETSYSYYEED